MNATNSTRDNIESQLSAEQLAGFARHYTGPLKRYFRKRGCQDATVDDLIQEVFTRLFARSSGGAIRNPEAYLMRTASGVWNDFLRKRKTHAHGRHVEYEESAHAPHENSTERVYTDRESIGQLLRALDELPERTRHVFVLCRIEGMRHKAVTQRLGISVSSVEKHLVKAIAHLAHCLG